MINRGREKRQRDKDSDRDIETILCLFASFDQTYIQVNPTILCLILVTTCGRNVIEINLKVLSPRLMLGAGQKSFINGI